MSASRFYVPRSHAEVPVTIYRRAPLPTIAGYGNVNSHIVGRNGYHESDRDVGVAPTVKYSASSNDEDVHVANRAMPSTMAQDLANDIESLEGKCNQLEDRNAWLSKKLLQNHQNFIERTMVGNAKNRLRRSFDSWREAMQEMVLERQLQEQTMSLDQCQQVAQELAAALAQEQQARKMCEADHMKLQDDLQRAILQEKRLKEQSKDQQFHLEILEKRVLEAESCLARSRADAQAVVESAVEYDNRRREIESSPDRDDRSRRRQAPTVMEHSLRLREEAQEVMRNVSGYLHRQPTP